MENHLLKEIKVLESKVDTTQQLEIFKSYIEKLKETDVEPKIIAKYEERSTYFAQCLENQAKKELLLQQLKEEVSKEEADLQHVNVLQQQFNQVAYAGKNTDEKLTREFKDVLVSLQEKKDAIRNQKIKVLLEKQELKKAIIEKTKKVLQLENLNEVKAKLNELFEEWKKIGYSGKEDTQLWEEFQKHRQVFYDKRKAYFAQLERSQEESAKLKQSLIEKAKAFVEKEDYSNEMADQFKQLDVEWKNVKNAGKQEEQLWKSYQETKALFWEKRNQLTAEKFEAFKATAHEIIARKQQQIDNLSQQLLDLRTRVGSIRNDEQVQRMKGWMDEKVTIITKLETEVANLKAKIEKK